MQLMPSLQDKLKQSLVMTPQLQQAIKLLQMTNLDIAAFLQEQALENPFIEFDGGRWSITFSCSGCACQRAQAG